MTKSLEKISNLEREKLLLEEVKAARIERLMGELTDVSYRDFGRESNARPSHREELTDAAVVRIVRLRVSQALKKERERTQKHIAAIKRIYFDAGRFSAGARDVNAQSAHDFVMSGGGE